MEREQEEERQRQQEQPFQRQEIGEREQIREEEQQEEGEDDREEQGLELGFGLALVNSHSPSSLRAPSVVDSDGEEEVTLDSESVTTTTTATNQTTTATNVNAANRQGLAKVGTNNSNWTRGIYGPFYRTRTTRTPPP